MREAYSRASRETGVEWSGRSYQRQDWRSADPINRALSAANSCLYGIVQSAIISAGYSTALGFIHTGKMLSFVYDIADLYKAVVTIPLAFKIVAEGEDNLESRIRKACRDSFYENRILSRIIPDIDKVLDVPIPNEMLDEYDIDDALPGGLWNGGNTSVEGGKNYEEEEVF